jgi:hypothetical protein
MTTIYLTHPLHGAKVATMQEEADADIANGWSVFDPSEVAPLAPSQPEAEKPILNALPVRRARVRK